MKRKVDGEMDEEDVKVKVERWMMSTTSIVCTAYSVRECDRVVATVWRLLDCEYLLWRATPRRGLHRRASWPCPHKCGGCAVRVPARNSCYACYDGV